MFLMTKWQDDNDDNSKPSFLRKNLTTSLQLIIGPSAKWVGDVTSWRCLARHSEQALSALTLYNVTSWRCLVRHSEQALSALTLYNVKA